MIFSASGKFTLILEGDDDVRLFKPWLVDGNASVRRVDGKVNVYEVWRKSLVAKAESIVCIADADYDVMEGKPPPSSERFILVSVRAGDGPNSIECNDIESALIRSDALLKVMANKYRGADLYGDCFVERIHELREKLRCAARNIGAFRAADRISYASNGRSPIGGELRVEDYFDPHGIELDVKKLAWALGRSSRAGQPAMDAIIERGWRLLDEFDKGWQLCRGHDLTEMLALHLSTFFDRRVSRREVEEDLRLACELRMLNETAFGRALRKLEESHSRQLLQSA